MSNVDVKRRTNLDALERMASIRSRAGFVRANEL